MTVRIGWHVNQIILGINLEGVVTSDELIDATKRFMAQYQANEGRLPIYIILNMESCRAIPKDVISYREISVPYFAQIMLVVGKVKDDQEFILGTAARLMGLRSKFFADYGAAARHLVGEDIYLSQSMFVANPQWIVSVTGSGV